MEAFLSSIEGIKIGARSEESLHALQLIFIGNLQNTFSLRSELLFRDSFFLVRSLNANYEKVFRLWLLFLKIQLPAEYTCEILSRVPSEMHCVVIQIYLLVQGNNTLAQKSLKNGLSDPLASAYLSFYFNTLLATLPLKSQNECFAGRRITSIRSKALK